MFLTRRLTKCINTFRVQTVQSFCQVNKESAKIKIHRADLFKRDLLCPEDLSSDDLKNILWTAIDMKHTIWKPGNRVKKSWLRGYNVAVVDGLQENKFTTAINNSVHMLGANLNQIRKTLNDEDHELNEDDGRIYGTLSDAVFVTAIGHKCLEEMARGTDTPIINIRTRKHQLLKAMADAMTMLEYFGYLKGLTVGYLGKPTPLLNSYVCMMPLLGINLKFRSCEEDHDTALTPVTMDVSKRLSLQSKSQVKQCDTCTETMDGLDVIVLKKAPIKKEPSGNACADKINLQDLKNLKEKWMLLHSFPSASFISKDLYCHENNKVLDSVANVVWISAACLIRVVKGYEFKRDMPDFDNHADR